jgi:thioredoxin reductase (NADPH)
MPGAEQVVDCLIVGAGPAGLTAAIYLGRYRRNVILIDSNESRASLIPKTHNYPGFASGISGSDLLEALREQARAYGITVEHGLVRSIAIGPSGFFNAESTLGPILARRVILATGLVDKDLPIPRLRGAIDEGLLRYCPICDGYEAMNQRICVVGSAEDASNKALFLRTYSRNVTLLSLDSVSSESTIVERLGRAGVRVINASVLDIRRLNGDIVLNLSNKTQEMFDVVYPALGCSVRSELAIALGARHNDVGCLDTDDHQRTAIAGIYAIGDVVSDLHQMAVGTGHAAIAATHIHNSLDRNLA